MSHQAPAQTTERTAIYRLYDEADRLLYVGITSEPRTRLRGHRRDQEWWPEVVMSEIEWCETRAAAEVDEKRAIEEEHPKYNRVFNGRQYRYGTRRFQATRLHPIALNHFGTRPFSYRDLTEELGVPTGTVVSYGNRLVAEGLFKKVGRWKSTDGRQRNHFTAVPA